MSIKIISCGIDLPQEIISGLELKQWLNLELRPARIMERPAVDVGFTMKTALVELESILG